ncbi:MAG: diphthamide biosynthesis enzyme Dph2 [Candidatus Hadarchaeaceae archaeon]
MNLYDFERARVKRFLRQHRAKRAGIQLPAGLRRHLQEIVEPFTEADVETLVLADSCYGACDPADARAKQLGCDVLVHYGHADMGVSTCLPTLYIEARMPADPLRVVERVLFELKFKRVGILTNVQHIAHLREIVKLLRSRGIKPFVGRPGPRAKYPGQLLGCDWGCARSVATRVDGFLYIGTGEFHPLGVALATGKQVLAVNPISGGFKALAPNVNAFLQRRKGMIVQAAAGKRFGIVVSTKPGQARFKLAARLAGDLRRAGKVAHILAVNEVRPEELGDFGFDGFICVACPRIPIDDAERFERPILTPFEARVMLGKVKFEPYQMDDVGKKDF